MENSPKNLKDHNHRERFIPADKKNPIFKIILEKAYYRAKEWKTYGVETLPPHPEWLHEKHGDNTVVLGGRSSMVGMDSKTKYILRHALIPLDLENRIYGTSGQIARDYVYYKYDTRPWTAEQRTKVRSEITGPPQYAKPTKFDNGAYIDLTGAFWSVMVRTGWNVDYFPSKWIGLGIPPLDFPFPENKITRNSLVSVGRSKLLRTWTKEKGMIWLRTGNKRPNDQLYCLIMDVLNGVATEAIEAGAIYVHTDGYIAPNSKVADKITQICMDWGFTPHIDATGDGEVISRGSYRVGRKRTKDFNYQKSRNFSEYEISAQSDLDNIKILEYHKWLRKKMSEARSRAVWHDNFVVRRPRIFRP